MVHVEGGLQVALEELVGVAKGSGVGVFAGGGDAAHADRMMLMRRMGMIFDIFRKPVPIDFLLDLII